MIILVVVVQMFISDTKLRQPKADAALREIMGATLHDMFDGAAQVGGSTSGRNGDKALIT